MRIAITNGALMSLLGCESFRDLMDLSQGKFIELVHPDDRRLVHEALEGDSPRQHFRLLAKGGEEKRIAASGRRVDLGDGKYAIYSVYYKL